MKTLYLDLSTGVSGDMLVAALSSACASVEERFEAVRSTVAGLSIKGLEIGLRKDLLSGVKVWRFSVRESTKQPLRYIADIQAIISRARFDDQLNDRVMKTFNMLAEAESFVHGVAVDQVHFHEIGAVDTIVDIVAVHALLGMVGVEKIVCSPVNLGSGFVTFSHGTFAVPAPAVAELSKGMVTFGSAPDTGSGMEMATPTGMALVKTVAHSFGPQPQGMVEQVGVGAGDRSDEKNPNMVRAFVLDAGPQESANKRVAT